MHHINYASDPFPVAQHELLKSLRLYVITSHLLDRQLRNVNSVTSYIHYNDTKLAEFH